MSHVEIIGRTMICGPVSYRVDIGGNEHWRRHVDQVGDSSLPVVELVITVQETVIDHSRLTGPGTVGDHSMGSTLVQSSQQGNARGGSSQPYAKDETLRRSRRSSREKEPTPRYITEI